ncbi:MAG: DUF2080 family transposase-associated protein [Candidatus Diapherotrites archaeon]
MLKSFRVEEEVVKPVVKFGNGSVVFTPKRWIGRKVTVILPEEVVDVKADVLKALEPFSERVQGVYLFGSYARGEETRESDVDVLVFSSAKLGLKKSGKLDFFVSSKEKFGQELKKDNSLFLEQVVSEAKPLFNGALLDELRKVRVKPDLGGFLNETLGAFKSVESLLSNERKAGRKALSGNASIYSLVLRLRSLNRIQLFLKGKQFTSKGFNSMLESHGFSRQEIAGFTETYRAERDERKAKESVSLEEAERLFEAAKIEFLKTEKAVKARGRKKKEMH